MKITEYLFWIISGFAIGILTVLSLYGMFVLVSPNQVFDLKGAIVVVTIYMLGLLIVGWLYKFIFKK